KLILFFTTRLSGSMTLTVPPISEDTHNSEPSSLNWAKRGRASTRILATIWCVAVSMKCAMLVVSDVFTRILPSGLNPIPSGSTPAFNTARRGGRLIVYVGTILVFLVGTEGRRPGGSSGNRLGAGPEGRVVTTLFVGGLVIWDVSSSPTATRTYFWS